MYIELLALPVKLLHFLRNQNTVIYAAIQPQFNITNVQNIHIRWKGTTMS